MDLDVAGGHCLSHTVDGLAGVDARVTLTEARDVQGNMTKVKGAAAAGTCRGIVLVQIM